MVTFDQNVDGNNLVNGWISSLIPLSLFQSSRIRLMPYCLLRFPQFVSLRPTTWDHRPTAWDHRPTTWDHRPTTWDEETRTRKSEGERWARKSVVKAFIGRADGETKTPLLTVYAKTAARVDKEALCIYYVA